LDWQFAGVASVHGGGASDLVLRNVKAGFLEVYDIANNQLMEPQRWVESDWIGSSVVCRRPADRLHGRFGRSACLKRTALAGDGQLRRRQRRGRWFECCPPRCRHVTTDVSDDADRSIPLGFRTERAPGQAPDRGPCSWLLSPS
jgi:hypothetical protein